jgi:hypothetical protein
MPLAIRLAISYSRNRTGSNHEDRKHRKYQNEKLLRHGASCGSIGM